MKQGYIHPPAVINQTIRVTAAISLRGERALAITRKWGEGSEPVTPGKAGLDRPRIRGAGGGDTLSQQKDTKWKK